MSNLRDLEMLLEKINQRVSEINPSEAYIKGYTDGYLSMLINDRFIDDEYKRRNEQHLSGSERDYAINEIIDIITRETHDGSYIDLIEELRDV